jgi:hypothetical protein
MDIATLVTVLTQLGMAAAAWRLANALKVKVDDHEERIGVLEAK